MDCINTVGIVCFEYLLDVQKTSVVIMLKGKTMQKPRPDTGLGFEVKGLGWTGKQEARKPVQC